MMGPCGNAGPFLCHTYDPFLEKIARNVPYAVHVVVVQVLGLPVDYLPEPVRVPLVALLLELYVLRPVGVVHVEVLQHVCPRHYRPCPLDGGERVVPTHLPDRYDLLLPVVVAHDKGVPWY